MSRLPFYLIVGILMMSGIALTIYRHVHNEVPWLPGEQYTVWSVEAQINLEAMNGPVKVDFALPFNQEGFRILNEHTASSGYGLAFVEGTSGMRRAQWTIREASGRQQLYYTVQILETEREGVPDLNPPARPQDVLWDAPYDTAADQVIARANQRSADAFTFARELIAEIGGDQQGENARLLLTQYSPGPLLVRLLHQAGVAAREVSGLTLEHARRRQGLTTWLQVYDGDQWQLFNPRTGEQGKPDNLLLWEAASTAVLEVEGGRNSGVSFSMLREGRPASATLEESSAGQADDTLLNLSIHSLPLEERALFMTILLMPIGALVVVILRILVGIRTSGTFMPVLIALAFIQTTLLTGLIGFLLVVSVGLMIRSYLSRLNLLLVARVSAVIITVIAIISVFSVVSYRLGLEAGLTITFFPMIILSWTIERMSILWEEEGPHEVLVQGGGSLLTAIVAYLAMTNPWIRHITFNFIGVQLILMSLILLLGNYTGYRLVELWRFKPLSAQDK